MRERLLGAARVGSVAQLVSAAAMLLSYPAMALAALAAGPTAFAVAAVLSYVCDRHLHHRNAYLLSRLSKARAGLSLRFLMRQLLFVLLLVRLDPVPTEVVWAVLVGYAAFFALQAPHSALTLLLRNRRRVPVVTRNIDLTGLHITDGPPRALTRRASEKMLHLDLFTSLGVLLTAWTGRDAWARDGAVVTVALGVVYVLALLVYARPSRLVPGTDDVLAWFDGWLRDYRPTTVLYFSGSAESTYQVNMWLRTLEELEGRPLVVLRERHSLSRLAATSVPVVCVPSAVHLMNADLSSVRVALYAANVGKNIHMLRVPTMKHVFIGHGDSDKIASVNPYSKAYDECWTAGRAGRDRWALADVGVRDDAIVETGRPQLAPIQGPRTLPAGRVPTVLYAPTWEGWTDDPGNTSLIEAGENIVRGLLDAERQVRVLYKPHPFTGTRSPLARAAHQRIVELLESAATGQAVDDERSRREASEEIARIDAELDDLVTRDDDGADEAQTARDSRPDPARLARVAELRQRRNDAYWRASPPSRHQVITGSAPTLYDCFNESDAMVSDISSVVSDFIASGKPYAVTDSAALGAEEFARQNTAVRAAVILDNDASGLDRLLAAVADPSADELAGRRAELKTYLLGADEPPSLKRFQAALDSLAARAESRNAQLDTPDHPVVDAAEETELDASEVLR